jgi:hypothetical protein
MKIELINKKASCLKSKERISYTTSAKKAKILRNKLDWYRWTKDKRRKKPDEPEYL